MPKAQASRKTILVVEDNEDLRTLLLEVLYSEGYEVSGAADGGVAQDLLAQNNFDLVLLDLGLPVVSGLEILQHLRERTIAPKVIVMTGDDTTETILRVVQAQAYQLISKPAARSAYLDAVQQALSQSGEVAPIEI